MSNDKAERRAGSPALRDRLADVAIENVLDHLNRVKNQDERCMFWLGKSYTASEMREEVMSGTEVGTTFAEMIHRGHLSQKQTAAHMRYIKNLNLVIVLILQFVVSLLLMTCFVPNDEIPSSMGMHVCIFAAYVGLIWFMRRFLR